MKKNRILNILISVLLVVLVGVFLYVQYSEHKSNKLQKEYELIETARQIPNDDNSINLLSHSETGDSDEGLVLSHAEFSKGFKRTSFYSGETSGEYRFPKTLYTSENMYLLSFKMKSEISAVKVRVKFGNEHIFYITPTLHEYCFPCSSAEIDNIKWVLESDFQKIYLYDVNVSVFNKNGLDFTKVKAGTYTVPEIEKYDFAENEGIGVGKSMDIVGDGKYLYSAGNETLTISSITKNDIKVISKLEGIGNIRHLKLKDDKTLAVASRENGISLINIEDKENPYILSRYDSLEIANDVCFSGDYMFVAGRYFGVEIVDVSDLSTPVMVHRIVNEEECFRCIVQNEHLFVGCWSTGAVQIYDISNLLKPTLVSTVSVDGRCAGMFLENNILYVASGYKDTVNAKNVGDIGYATGNGVTIYDISDIKYPRWCSTIKTEGSLYGNGYDDWSVQVSDGYVYFTNSFGGMYIYDIKDIHNPQSVANVRVPVYPSSDNFADFSKSSNHVFPYNVKEFILSPAMGVHVDNGAVYIACAYNDVYRYPFEPAKLLVNDDNNFTYKLTASNIKRTMEYKTLLPEHDMYVLANYGENMYLAGTNEGILLLDNNLSVVSRYITENPVKDLKVSVNNLIVTTEKFLVSTYKIENNEIIHCGSVKSKVSNPNVSALEITGDGKFAVTQSSWTKIEAVNLSDANNPVLVNNVVSVHRSEIPFNNISSPGNMYYKNIVKGTVNGAVGVGANKTFIWFESKNGKLTVSNSYSNKFASETNGSAPLDESDSVLTVYNNGYVVYNPLTITDQQINLLTTYYVPNLRIKGKASINGDILVATNAPNGWIYVLDISDVYNPYLIGYYDCEQSVGTALIKDDCILIPARHSGIIKIELYH